MDLDLVRKYLVHDARGGAEMKTWNWHAAPLIAAAISVLATGCTAGSGSAALTSLSRPEEPDVTVAALPAADLAGLYVAQDYGFFAQQGLHVTIKKIASSAAVIADQLKGAVDITAGSYVAYVAAQAAGARFRILAEASALQPNTRVLVITANSPVKTLNDLVGKKIGLNGTNSIGTLLISALLVQHGISPGKVTFVTDPQGFPAMPTELQDGAWAAAFLAEPYFTVAGEEYGERELADLDQGATVDFPIDGYMATQAWAQKYPKTAAAFVRAIEEGQALADSDRAAVEKALGESDDLPRRVTAAIALPDFPVGPVDETRIQRTAEAMLQFGLLSKQYTAEVQQGTLIKSMIAPGS
jgi:NitT/TauT family transport system substrate-binding protein